MIQNEAKQYRAYGMTFRSTIDFPELHSSAEPPDICISEEESCTDSLSEDRAARRNESFQLKWGSLFSADVEGGQTVRIRTFSAVDPNWMRQCLLGPVFGLLLHQKKYLVLHASAVEIDGKAVVLMGEKGAGKSTLAAVLHSRGHLLYTDDVVAIDLSGNVPLVLPGTSQIRLWPDSAGAAELELDAGHAIHADIDKRVWSVESSRTDPLPLGCIYALSYGDADEIRSLSTAGGFSTVVDHLYARRFFGGRAVEDRFHDCARLASSIPILEFCRRRDLSDIAAQAALLENMASARQA